MNIDALQYLAITEGTGKMDDNKDDKKKEDTITMERRELNNALVRSVDKISKVLLGNGHPEDGLFYKFSRMQATVDDVVMPGLADVKKSVQGLSKQVNDIDSTVNKVVVKKMNVAQGLMLAVLTAVITAMALWVLSGTFAKPAPPVVLEVQMVYVTPTALPSDIRP